jgi:hypothetical protein
MGKWIASFLLAALIGSAQAQTFLLPNVTVPSNSVLGNNLPIAAGGNAIPFAVLTPQLLQSITGDLTCSATTQTCTIGNGAVTNGKLATATQNTVKGAATSTAEADLTMPSCSTANSGVQWTTNTGFGCRTSLADLATQDQTLSGGANVTSLSQSNGNLTIDCGARPLQFITNGGAFTLTAPSNDGSCILLVTNNASAGTITFSGFSVGTSIGDALTTTNGNKFSISVWRINSTSGYRVAAHQ